MNHCNICGTGGKLVCCESCPNAFHESCLNTEIPENDYICEDCTSRKYLVHGMIVWNKIGNYRWWPSQIIHPSYIPNNVKNMRHSDGEFCIRYFWAQRPIHGLTEDVNHLKPPVRAVTADENVISPCACDSSEQNPCGMDSSCLNRSMQIECHPNFCRAKELCQNQNFQKKNNVPTIPFRTVKRGWGLIALKDIKKGQFVIEYVGEVITHKECELRKSDAS
ncbi:histone-lysine N-methyltransferase, H3 lysine-36 specific [Caerostris extrusa]|uniref:Histone-lysine N-methyltransferase, H3 lysine-36 specific n=1 Tax=Caerostris extrusa TaxID=172846 RepID=A0AAV4RP89_CAEEX|nr:histone-lysine N-methyltransferase, H3 lysine-36 specific [Caerostris extrusa]